ncbi:Activated RNA polymerase II transcriptional coactivator p15 [Araneus ventricosus]|uniref:Activated RNA polymerase II transcriptional coactivator p15 n=1 Tax=Araneus ventricosus TaxID=182803 RepID=A0A4Y2HHF3_ARAVE|nr:Activated RNA polymerase II transcriptional coactivator p15 [Araneus ventricosus]
MSSKKSRKSKLSDSDSDSGPDDRNPPAKKSKNEKPAAASTSEDGDLIKLSKYRYVSVREFRGKLMVDIREYYEKDGEMKPGKKGICLNMEQWNALKEQMENIEAAIKKY